MDGLISPRKVKNIPLFEETVSYINTFLKENKTSDMLCDTDKYLFRNAGVGEDLQGDVYLLSMYTREQLNNGVWLKTDTVFRIKISNVEAINITHGKGEEGSYLPTGLWLVEKDANSTPKMHLPLWKVAYDNRGDLKQEKIFKAFEQLRKLCGE